MQEKVTCPLCQSKEVYVERNYEKTSVFYECPLCGRYELLHIGNNSLIDKNKFASYMFYHCYDANDAFEMRYNTMMSKEMCDQYKAEYDKGNNICGRPVHIDKEIIDNWYPQTLSERIDYILLYFAEHTKHIGQNIKFDNNAIFSLLFVDRYEIRKPDYYSNNQNLVLRTEEDCKLEALYVLDYLKQSNMISYSFDKSEGEYTINISPLGYNRVDELQKYSFNGKSVLVAMKFGQDTIKLREAIRKGITDAGYVAIFIDEVQHNDFITPELLKHIRDSKFVVADLTHQNNGAYFEEGYAMGLGKPVIQLCSSDTKLHFDIAQKNTIIWNSESDIPEMLYNRIKATIG